MANIRLLRLVITLLLNEVTTQYYPVVYMSTHSYHCKLEQHVAPVSYIVLRSIESRVCLVFRAIYSLHALGAVVLH